MTARELTPAQRLAAETFAVTGDASAAAEAAGVTARTLRRWRQLPEFGAAVDDALSQVFARTRRDVLMNSTTAVDVLRQTMTDATAPHAVRVRAALGTLGLSRDLHDDDVARRLDALEERLGHANA